MLKFFFSLLISTLTVLSVLASTYSQNKVSSKSIKWDKIYDGISFMERDYGKWFKKGKLYAIKISKPRKIKFLKNTKDHTSLDELEKKYKSLIIINGSYFDEKYKPVGLLKIDDKIIKDKNDLGSSGILAIKDSEVNIFNKKEYSKYKNFPNLMQNGPLLVEENGKQGIYSDDHEYTSRTTIGITKKDDILIVIADRAASPSLWEISQLLSKNENEGGFNCRKVINLDGGSSTGLRINLPNKKLVVEENDFINNAIGVF